MKNTCRKRRQERRKVLKDTSQSIRDIKELIKIDGDPEGELKKTLLSLNDLLEKTKALPDTPTVADLGIINSLKFEVGFSFLEKLDIEGNENEH